MKRSKSTVLPLITAAALLLFFAIVTGFQNRTVPANYLVVKSGHVTSRGLIKGPDGPIISAKYKYDRNGNRTEVTDPRLKKTVTEYDSWNRPWKVAGPGYDENGSIIETFTEYDGGGNVVRTVDGRGTDRTWIRDKRGLVEKYTDGEGEETSYQYDLNGNTRFITDGRNTVTEITYDDEDREKKRTEAKGTSDERTKEVILRDRMGNPTKVKDYNGNITETVYNKLYLPKEIIDPSPYNGQSVKMTYYKTGKLHTEENRRGFTTRYEYDDLNRLRLVTDPKDYTIVTTYDKVGNVETVRDKRKIIT
ncbi:MAG: RHS repeat protein, partial [Gammaproteobacteria bacterium]|nr:RHS repeat protein [Gammaproteobacteria bacterium]